MPERTSPPSTEGQQEIKRLAPVDIAADAAQKIRSLGYAFNPSNQEALSDFMDKLSQLPAEGVAVVVVDNELLADEDPDSLSITILWGRKHEPASARNSVDTQLTQLDAGLKSSFVTAGEFQNDPHTRKDQRQASFANYMQMSYRDNMLIGVYEVQSHMQSVTLQA